MIRALSACLLPLILLLTEVALAQVSAPAPDPTARPRTALVLSGGGARGLAHVGVLKALEEARVPVDFVVGTSMGAIIGGLYASGMSAADLERELLAVDWGGVFATRAPRQQLSQRQKEEDFEFSPVLRLGFRDGEFRLPSGAVSTRSLEILLRRYTLASRHLSSFDGLPTPFRAVATDLETGQPVVLAQGDLAAALRASMSVPGVFAPLELGGRILGDGGLVNNLPVDVARALGAQRVIAVNIGTPLAGRDTLSSVLGLTTQMINILTEQNVQRSLASLGPNDLLLAPPLGALSAADFDRAVELVALGHGFASQSQNALSRFSVDASQYQQWAAQRRDVHQALAAIDGKLAFVRLEGVAPQRMQRLMTQIESAPGDAVDTTKVERDLQRLAASGDYMRLDYRLERSASGEGEGLVYGLTENDWGPNYLRLGLSLRTDLQGQAAFTLGLSHNRHWLTANGAQWRNRVALGEHQGWYTEFYQPLDPQEDRFVAAYADYQLRRIELFDADGSAQAVFRRQGTRLGLDFGWTLGRGGALGEVRMGWTGSARTTRPDLVASRAGGVATRQRWTEHGVRLSVVSDQLDYANFPQSGYRLWAELQAGRRYSSGANTDFSRMETTASAVRSWGRHTLNAHLRYARASHIPVGAVDEYSLGGFQRLSGYRVGQVAGNHLLFGRLGYYRRLDINPGVARALFAGGSLEAGNAWSRREDMSLGDLRLSGSVYIGADTGVGPLYLSLVHAPRGFTGVYLFLGRP